MKKRGKIYYICSELATLIDKVNEEIEDALGIKVDKIETSKLIAQELEHNFDVNKIIKRIKD